VHLANPTDMNNLSSSSLRCDCG